MLCAMVTFVYRLPTVDYPEIRLCGRLMPQQMWLTHPGHHLWVRRRAPKLRPGPTAGRSSGPALTPGAVANWQSRLPRRRHFPDLHPEARAFGGCAHHSWDGVPRLGVITPAWSAPALADRCPEFSRWFRRQNLDQ